ncbi:DegV family protein [Sedimentibacter sp. zth1]|uniref:DegV family protein n=1 Tax=Sedimentibacter sp. zth1 TaxID=2816908 RepID=UPI001A92936A|nr:DegV family protein [Sedimentibacter sp. zth1]QSX05389.1 DegV family protein [Sedimentibacter sp. zth1]
MNNNSIAIVIDSCTDVPRKYIERYNMFVLPILINFKNNSYRDGIDISNEEVYKRLNEEIPKTSLPCLDLIEKTFQKIENEGYKKVIVVTMSSRLSGTGNAIRLIASRFTTLNTFVLDTKNIGIGAGFSAISAAELVEKENSFEEIKNKLLNNIKNTKVFFCLKTLEYLKKGGRIGLVSGVIGSLLDVKPIISCNEDGVYYSLNKCIGRKQSINKTLSFARKFADKFSKYNIALVHGNALEEINTLEISVKNTLKSFGTLLKGTVSPALGVHTGPGLIGIGIQKVIE